MLNPQPRRAQAGRVDGDDEMDAIAERITEYRIACAWTGVEPLLPSALAQMVVNERGRRREECLCFAA